VPKTENAMSREQMDLCIRETAKGSHEAFRRLYDECHRPIYLFALTILRDAQQAQDAVQETFLNLYAFAGTYRPGTNPRAWIFAIARNASTAILKKTPKNLVSPDALEHQPAVGADPAEESWQDLTALSVLNEDEQKILSLYVFAGLTQPEIARLLDLPYRTVRAKYGYAIKKLKKYYLTRGDA